MLKKTIKKKSTEGAPDTEDVKKIFEDHLEDVHSDHEVDYNEDLTQDQKDDLTLPEFNEE